jgi:hypothetical protein
MGRIKKLKNLYHETFRKNIPEDKIKNLEEEFSEKVLNKEQQELREFLNKDIESYQEQVKKSYHKKQEQEFKQKKDLIKQEVDNSIEIKQDDELTSIEKGDDVEKAVGISIKTLSNPEHLKHFSDISKEKSGYMSMGIAYCQSIGYENPLVIFDNILELYISSKRKGRTELKEVGVAGVQREKDTGIMDKLKFWKRD